MNDLEVAQNHDFAMTRPPAMVLAEAKKAADALQQIIKGKKDPVKFNGQQYIEFEDWQVLGKFYGITTKVVSTTPVEFGDVRGFEARAVAVDNRTGIEVSAADAMCLNDEDKWSSRTKYKYEDELDAAGNRIWVNDPKAKNGKGYYKSKKVADGTVQVPMFQLRSMAQTRACAKALRNVLAWVVVLAGYKPSVAEEMTGDEETGKPAPETIAQPQRKSEAPAAPAEAAQATPPATALDRSKMKPMTAKFDSKCADCGTAISKGDTILYDAEAKKVVHHAPCV